MNKETRRLLAAMEFKDIVTNCNILKIPSVEVVITMKVDELFYLKDNKWHVNEQLIYKQIKYFFVVTGMRITKPSLIK